MEKTWRVPRKEKKKVKQMFYERAKKRGFPCRTRKEKYWVLHSMLWNEPKKFCFKNPLVVCGEVLYDGRPYYN